MDREKARGPVGSEGARSDRAAAWWGFCAAQGTVAFSGLGGAMEDSKQDHKRVIAVLLGNGPDRCVRLCTGVGGQEGGGGL